MIFGAYDYLSMPINKNWQSAFHGVFNANLELNDKGNYENYAPLDLKTIICRKMGLNIFIEW